MATNPTADYFAFHPAHKPPKGPAMATHMEADSDARHEAIILLGDEKKVSVDVDTRKYLVRQRRSRSLTNLGMPNTCIFTFMKEDHTLGNLLRARLFQNPHVLFSGYKIEHPLFHKFILRVQTDGDITPKDAVLGACKDLVNDLGVFSREFTKEWELRKMVGAGAQQNGTNGY